MGTAVAGEAKSGEGVGGDDLYVAVPTCTTSPGLMVSSALAQAGKWGLMWSRRLENARMTTRTHQSKPSSKLGDKAGTRFFNGGDGQFAAHARVLLKEVVQRVAALQVVD